MQKGKRGQHSVWFPIILVLAVIVLFVVAIGFTKGWDTFTDFFDKSDVDITFLSQKCEISSSGPGYCADVIQISDNSYVNCPYAVANLGINVTKGADCDSDAGARAICNKLALEEGDNFDGDKVKVNNKVCNNWLPCEIKEKGIWKDSCDGDTEEEKTVTGGSEGKKCCAPKSVQ